MAIRQNRERFCDLVVCVLKKSATVIKVEAMVPSTAARRNKEVIHTFPSFLSLLMAPQPPCSPITDNQSYQMQACRRVKDRAYKWSFDFTTHAALVRMGRQHV
ncbi:hypothetical protein D9M71_466730 [compost metagenome]